MKSAFLRVLPIKEAQLPGTRGRALPIIAPRLWNTLPWDADPVTDILWIADKEGAIYVGSSLDLLMLCPVLEISYPLIGFICYFLRWFYICFFNYDTVILCNDFYVQEPIGRKTRDIKNCFKITIMCVFWFFF